MSRVQLALNVSNLDEAITFYTKLFGTQPAKIREGYANFAIAEPPLKLVLIQGSGAPGTLNHLGVEVHHPPAGRGPAHRRGRQHHLLLRGAGQGVGARPRRRAVGGVHRARRRARHAQGSGRR